MSNQLVKDNWSYRIWRVKMWLLSKLVMLIEGRKRK